MNIQTVLYLSGMSVILGLALFVFGTYPSKCKILRIVGISIMVVAMTVGGTASSFVIQTALQETQAQE
jgi:hypothetical protein